MILELEILFWSLLVSGIWFGAITQLRNKNQSTYTKRDKKELDDFFKLKIQRDLGSVEGP